jgi:hypothetical protein
LPATVCQDPSQADPGIFAIDVPAFASDWAAIDVSPGYRYDTERAGLVADQTVIGVAAAGVVTA